MDKVSLSLPVSAKAEDRTDILLYLSLQIRALEASGKARARLAPFGLATLDRALGGGLPLSATHEILGDRAAASGFLCAVLNCLPPGPILWITRHHTLYPPGLPAYGLDPGRFVFVAARRDQDALWAMEEGLRTSGLAAVVAEVGDASLTATRRLQLAVENGGGAGFMLRTQANKSPASACATRWRIMPAPSVPEDGLPGLGFSRWQVELLKARGSGSGAWMLEWRDGRLQTTAATLPDERRQPGKVAGWR